MVKTVTAVAARQRLGDLLNRVAIANEEIIIERAGKKVAKLVGCEKKTVAATGKLDFRKSAGLGSELWGTVESDASVSTERSMEFSLKSGDTLFLDPAPLVYFWLKQAPYYEKLVALFDQVYALDIQCTISLITYTEVVGFALKKNEPRVAAKYRDYLTNSSNMNLYPLNLLVADKTALFMAKYDLKMPAAVQLATAGICGADYVLTNNREWEKVKSLRIVQVADL